MLSLEPRKPRGELCRGFGSPLCHVSVGKWMKASGYAFVSPEREDRCARVSASVAYQLVQRLNTWKDDKYESRAT